MLCVILSEAKNPVFGGRDPFAKLRVTTQMRSFVIASFGKALGS